MNISIEAKQAIEHLKPFTERTNIKMGPKERDQLVIAYEEITKRKLSLACASECITSAMKIIKNYIAMYPEPIARVKSKKIVKLEPKKNPSASRKKSEGDTISFDMEQTISPVNEQPKDETPAPKKRQHKAKPAPRKRGRPARKK